MSNDHFLLYHDENKLHLMRWW